jgi:hypothetical protein
MAIPSWDRRLTSALQSYAPPSRKSLMYSTGVICSGCCRWGTPSLLNSLVPVGRTRRSMPLAASTTQGVALAEDWIRAGRCRRVIVVSADDITTDNLIGWMGAGFSGQRSRSHGRSG